MYTLTGKPNSVHDSADGEEDGKWEALFTCTSTRTAGKHWPVSGQFATTKSQIATFGDFALTLCVARRMKPDLESFLCFKHKNVDITFNLNFVIRSNESCIIWQLRSWSLFILFGFDVKSVWKHGTIFQKSTWHPLGVPEVQTDQTLN